MFLSLAQSPIYYSLCSFKSLFMPRDSIHLILKTENICPWRVCSEKYVTVFINLKQRSFRRRTDLINRSLNWHLLQNCRLLSLNSIPSIICSSSPCKNFSIGHCEWRVWNVFTYWCPISTCGIRTSKFSFVCTLLNFDIP